MLHTLVRYRLDDPAALDEEIRIESAARRFSRYYVRILDARSQTIIETPGMSAAPRKFFELSATGLTPEQLDKIAAPDHRTLALTTASAATNDGMSVRIQLALDISSQEQLAMCCC